jgi:hypothetical protein
MKTEGWFAAIWYEWWSRDKEKSRGNASSYNHAEFKTLTSPAPIPVTNEVWEKEKNPKK